MWQESWNQTWRRSQDRVADRFNPDQRVEVVVRPTKWFVPGGTAQESEHPGGFRVRVRGAGGHVTHAYRCPVHGLFDASVPRADVPDEMACPSRLVTVGDFDAVIGGPALDWRNVKGWPDSVYCGLTSHWAGSFCGQGWAAGECKT